ncbi:MAG: hypothetical protein LBB81_05390 [Treponema sp.]|jgi:hypothetical protein|nr:hypothetical protein [Treponema sp.]
MRDLNSLIFDTGNASGLFVDSEIESSHLVTAVIQDIPRIHERLVNINILLRGIENGEFDEKSKSELELHLGTLIFSDSSELQNRINFSEKAGAKRDSTGVFSFYENYLTSNNSILEHLSSEIYFIINQRQPDISHIAQLNWNIIMAHNSVFRLHEAALNKLETLSNLQIKGYYRRFIQSLIISFTAMAGAFVIIILTAKGIHNSVKSAILIFKKLETNDLTADFFMFFRR